MFLMVALAMAGASPIQVGQPLDEQALVRSGWKVVQETAGDLNGDKIPDRIVVFEKPDAKERRFVVALSEKGQLVIRETFPGWTGCRCGRFDAETLGPLGIKSGVLVLQEDLGSSDHTFETFRLRWKGDHLEVIGFDFEARNTLNAVTYVSASVNFLTGDFNFAEGKTKKRGRAPLSQPPLRAADGDTSDAERRASEIVTKGIGKPQHFGLFNG